MKPSEWIEEYKKVKEHLPKLPKWVVVVAVVLLLVFPPILWVINRYGGTYLDEKAKQHAALPSALPSAAPPSPELPDVALSWSRVAGDEVRLGPAVKLNEETRKGYKQYLLTVVGNTRNQAVAVDIWLQFRQQVSLAVVRDESGAEHVQLPPELMPRAVHEGQGAEVQFNEGARLMSSELTLRIHRLQPNGGHVAILVELAERPDGSEDGSPRGVPEEKTHYLWADATTEIGETRKKEQYYAPLRTEIDGSVTMPLVVHGRDVVPRDTWMQSSRSFSGGARLQVGAPGSKAAVMP